ncbi:MAG: enolase C-terminal domain-like protein, partial [Actinomycetes bacterium]
GWVGWGECPTLSSAGYATETTEVAWAGLTTQLGPALLEGRTVLLPGLTASTAAILDAALDAQLCSEGRPLIDELLGLSGSETAAVPEAPAPGLARGPTPGLARCAVIADLGASPSQLADRAREAVEGGAAMIKLKIAPGRDVEALRAVRQAIGDFPLAADANGSYSDREALRPVDRMGLVFVEQPFSAGLTWDELAQLRSAMQTPLALDESLGSLDALRSAVLAGSLDVVSVKPARLGGVRAAASAVEFASSAGLGVFVGGMLELGIGRAAAVAVAGLPGCTLPTDLGPSSQYVEQDICDPICVNPLGELIPPTGPGIGRVPDEAQLERCCIDEVVLRL